MPNSNDSLVAILLMSAPAALVSIGPDGDPEAAPAAPADSAAEVPALLKSKPKAGASVETPAPANGHDG